MKWSHLLVASAPVVGLQLVASAPAHASAAVLLGLGLPLASFSGLAGQVPDPSATSCVNSPNAPFGAGLDPSFAASKSSAILGGTPSKLELISHQQTAQAGQPHEALIGAKVEPAAGGFHCRRFAQSRAISTIMSPDLRPATAPEDFLASTRLPLTRTSFDAQWNKVRRSGLSSRMVSPIAAGRPDKAMLAAVNTWSNTRIRYREDRDLYGKADHWATAGATLRRGAGDCEDIAILKMQALAALGVPRSDMYLTIARDTVRNADHAVLVVKLDGRYWLLDNATNTLLDASVSHDYRPIMSFSSAGKWLHGYARQAGGIMASNLIAAR